MDITPLIPQGRMIIQRYGNGKFTVSDKLHVGDIVIFKQEVYSWNASQDKNYIELLSIIARYNHKNPVELLLIGAGENQMQMPVTLRQQLKEHHIASEIMSTGAACRTYNVLLAEGREVVAALVAV
jgi:uncharacterized protein